MTRLQKIEKVMQGPYAEKLSRFRDWFAEFDAASWDAQIEADASHRAGRTRPL